jgi:3'-5' exonuclease
MNLPDLMRQACRLGASFRLRGEQVHVTAKHPSPALVSVLAALRGEKEAIWSLLGGAAIDVPSLKLLGLLGVEAVVPRTLEEAQALIAEIEADSDANTPAAVMQSRGGLLGLDIETAANPGEEERPAVRLRLRDGMPAKHQPSLKGKAALDSHRSTIRLVQLYGGGKRCLVLDTRLMPIEVIAGLFAGRVMVVHNAAFELRFLMDAGLEMPRFEDTIQATGLLLGASRRSLDDAADAYLGVALPKGLQTSD